MVTECPQVIPTEDLFVEIGTDCNAIGSSTWEQSGHNVVCIIYGPDEIKPHEELTHRCSVEVSVMASGDNSEVIIEGYMTNIIERLIDVKEFPLRKLIIKFHIVCGKPSSPNTVAALTNALSLALLQTDLPMNATLSSISTDVLNAPICMTFDTSNSAFADIHKDVPLYSLYMAPSVSGIPPTAFTDFVRQVSTGKSDNEDVATLRKKLIQISEIMVAKLMD